MRDAEVFLRLGASVLLLSLLPALVGTRSPEAADGGGMREFPAGRGAGRVFVGGPRFGCGVGRGRGAEGGGMRELVLLDGERDGGRRCGCDGEAGCTDSVVGVWLLRSIGWDWFVVPFMVCRGRAVSA